MCNQSQWTDQHDYLISDGTCVTFQPARLAMLAISYIMVVGGIIASLYKLYRTGTKRLKQLKTLGIIVWMNLAVYILWFTADSLLVCGEDYLRSNLGIIISNALGTGSSAVVVALMVMRIVLIPMSRDAMAIPGQKWILLSLIATIVLSTNLTATLIVTCLVENNPLVYVFIRVFAATVIAEAILLCTCVIMVINGIMGKLGENIKMDWHSAINNYMRRLRIIMAFAIVSCLAYAVLIEIQPAWLEYLLPSMKWSHAGLVMLYYTMEN